MEKQLAGKYDERTFRRKCHLKFNFIKCTIFFRNLQYVDILAPILIEVYEEPFLYVKLPESFNQAIITALPKGN